MDSKRNLKGYDFTHRKTSSVSCTLVENRLVDHSDVVGASPVGAAPTTPSFWTERLASTDWARAIARWGENHLSFKIWCVLYCRYYGYISYSMILIASTVHCQWDFMPSADTGMTIFRFHCLMGLVLEGLHDDVIIWKLFPRYCPFVKGIHQWPVESPYKGQWHGALIFSLICPWINGWSDNRDAGDLRRHRAHFDVILI